MSEPLAQYANSFLSPEAQITGVTYVVGWSKANHTEIVSAWPDIDEAMRECGRMNTEELGAAWFVVTLPICSEINGLVRHAEQRHEQASPEHDAANLGDLVFAKGEHE